MDVKNTEHNILPPASFKTACKGSLFIASVQKLNKALNCFAVVVYLFNLIVIYVIRLSTNPFGKAKR